MERAHRGQRPLHTRARGARARPSPRAGPRCRSRHARRRARACRARRSCRWGAHVRSTGARLGRRTRRTGGPRSLVPPGGSEKAVVPTMAVAGRHAAASSAATRSAWMAPRGIVGGPGGRAATCGPRAAPPPAERRTPARRGTQQLTCGSRGGAAAAATAAGSTCLRAYEGANRSCTTLCAVGTLSPRSHATQVHLWPPRRRLPYCTPRGPCARTPQRTRQLRGQSDPACVRRQPWRRTRACRLRCSRRFARGARTPPRTRSWRQRLRRRCGALRARPHARAGRHAGV